MPAETRKPSPTPEDLVTLTINERYVDPEYPHTSNIGYLQIFQEVRNTFMDNLGFNLASLKKEGVLPFMINQSADYRGESKPGDNVEVGTSLEYNRRLVVFHQRMSLKGTVVAMVDCRYVLVDLETHRPRVIPQSLIERFRKV